MKIPEVEKKKIFLLLAFSTPTSKSAQAPDLTCSQSRRGEIKIGKIGLLSRDRISFFLS